jgi:hypothetical protein
VVSMLLYRYGIPREVVSAIVRMWDIARAKRLVRMHPTPLPVVVRLAPFVGYAGRHSLWTSEYVHIFCRGDFDYCKCHTDNEGMRLKNGKIRWKRSLMETKVILTHRVTGLRCGTQTHLLRWQKYRGSDIHYTVHT